MLVQTYFPDEMIPSRYDYYLAAGWFRGSVMLYKIDILCLDENIYSVVNIRMRVPDYGMKKRHRKLFRKNNRKYRVQVGEATISGRKEELYNQQKHNFKGFIHSSLSDFLRAGFMNTVFDTKQVEVFDGDKLIAVSYFDIGSRSLASLLCLYDKSYKKDSLGIFTMLHELEFAMQSEMKWYYPGYVLDQPSSFDYKLTLGEFEYFSTDKRWLPFSEFEPHHTPGNLLKQKTDALTKQLGENKIPHSVFLYPYFSMGYMGMWEVEFLKFPIFVMVDEQPDDYLILGYSIEDEKFKMLRTENARDYEYLINIQKSKELENSKNYFRQLLATAEQVCSAESPAKLVELLK